jgi:hypothetical protein
MLFTLAAMANARADIVAAFGRGSCIASTRIITELTGATPLAVTLHITKGEYTVAFEAASHLIAWAPVESLLIDATLDQVGIVRGFNLPALLVATTPADFLEHGAHYQCNGCDLVYTPDPFNRVYREATQWQDARCSAIADTIRQRRAANP